MSGALSKFELPSIDMKNEAEEVYTGSRSAWMRGDDPDAIDTRRVRSRTRSINILRRPQGVVTPDSQAGMAGEHG